MATFKVLDMENNEVGSIELDDSVFAAEVKTNLIYEVVRMQQAKKRAGTHSAKTRGEIRGSTAKLFRQKGTGRARRGSKKAPGLRGAGVVFGPKPRDYSFKVPKKVRKGALVSAISQRNTEAKLVILKDMDLGEIKTKKLAGVIEKLGLKRPLIIEADNNNLKLSARNIQGVDVLPPIGLNVYDILNHDELVFTEASVRQVEGALKR